VTQENDIAIRSLADLKDYADKLASVANKPKPEDESVIYD
jgi:hypothetical protein